MTTIKDVARAAKVSVSTVSLVLNDSSLVKMETRDKVLKVIKKLDYTPNQYARSLVTKTKKIIGVVWPTDNPANNLFSFEDNIDTYLAEMLPSIEKEINDSNYSMLVEHFCINDPSVSLPFIMSSNRVDGVLVTGGIVNDAFLEKLMESSIPTVLVGSRHAELDYVDTDPEHAIYLSAKYLIENGHRDIMFINGPESSQTSERKMKGFVKAMREYGLSGKEGWAMRADYSGIAAYGVMSRSWDRGIKPTGIIGASDSIAIGALRFLYERGIYCPKDVSAIGFEDGLLAAYSLPPLTSVRVYKERIGVEACRVLINRINQPDSEKVRLIIEPSLIVRGSVERV